VWASQPSALEGAVLEDALVAQVVEWQPAADGDLALLKVNNLPEPTPALRVAADPPSVGDEVTAIGYPGHVGSVSDPARLRASFKTGTVSSTQVTHEGVARTEVNADMAQGMSGGPTVDAGGAVVGVVSAGFADQAFNFMTDHAALEAFLDHHDVEASGAGASGTLTADPGLAVQGRTAPAGEFPVTSLVAAGGVALALAGGGTFLAGRRRPATAPASAAPADPTRFVGRPAWMTPGGARGPACAHSGSAPGSGYCGDCGTRLTGREFTADALVDRDGAVRVVVPRWREETRAGISVKGRTFASAAVTEVVTGALAAVRLTGPANVQGFVADDGTATVVEINPRFSGGLPLTLAAGADVVGAYLAGVRGEPLPELDFRPGIVMSRYFAETYRSEDGTPVEDPCAPVAVRA